MSQDKPQDANRQKNEGEGNRTAAREYNRDTREFIEKENVDKLAEQARKDLEGDKGDELRKAEEEGKRKAKGEDPQVRRQ
ncbi:MAG: hypothetical protein AB7P12_13610 [Alphaproteobacteria bacterium]